MLLTLGVALGACGSDVRLSVAGDGGAAGFSQRNTRTSVPFYVSTFNLCTDGGSVDIRRVGLHHERGLTLVDWGTRRYGGGPLGTYGRVLDKSRYTQGAFSRSCRADSRHQQLAVSVALHGRTGVTHGLDVYYGDDHLFVPFRIILCAQVCPKKLDDAPLP